MDAKKTICSKFKMRLLSSINNLLNEFNRQTFTYTKLAYFSQELIDMFRSAPLHLSLFTVAEKCSIFEQSCEH